MEKFCVYGKLMAQEGKVQELTAHMQEVAKEMQNLDTCFYYILGEKADEPKSIHIYEVWESEQAHNDSLTLEVFQNLIAKARPIIAGIENLHKLTIFDGKASF